MTTLKQVVSTLRKTLKNQAPLLARPFGLDVLSKAETAEYLAPAQIAFSPGRSITMPRTNDLADNDKVIFGETTVTAAHARVWSCSNTPDNPMRLLRNGSVSAGRRVPDTDFGTSALFKDLLVRKQRVVRQADTLIAPWSHYWGGYYDYLYFVAAKLCRIKDALPEAAFQEAVVAYPLLHTAFEEEILSRIGCRPENRLDSRTTDVRFSTAVLGNTDSWFYPNQADVLSLRKHITADLSVPTDTPERIYISRAGRRRVLNEPALIRLLEQYGFAIIDDKPRSLAEQVALYRNASFIIGPHGASFANILWCRPGTQLVELFAPGYTPDFFRYLAHLTGLRYAAYCHGPLKPHHFSNVNADLYVAPEQLEHHLIHMLEASQFT